MVLEESRWNFTLDCDDNDDDSLLLLNTPSWNRCRVASPSSTRSVEHCVNFVVGRAKKSANVNKEIILGKQRPPIF